MAGIRSLMELTPTELQSRPAIRNFGPFREQIIRQGWFQWFWMGRAIASGHTLLVGPFRTKRGAKNVWKNVPEWDKNDPLTGEQDTDWAGRNVRRAMQGRFPN